MIFKLEQSIKEHYQIDTSLELLETYLELIKSNRFSVDPVVLDCRENSKSINNRIDFTLEDGANVSISEDTFDILKRHINSITAISYMNDSKDNFIQMIKTIQD